MAEYSSDSIKHLEWLEHIRLRYSMYISDNSTYWLHHLFREVLWNSFDEIIAWHATEVVVKLFKDNSIFVKDNGRWIPVGFNKQTWKDSLELVTWTVNTSWKYEKWSENSWYKVSSWLNWLWIKIVNALSDFFEVHSYSISSDDKKRRDWFIRYENSKKVEWVKSLWYTNEKWTSVFFRPSEEIFWKLKYSSDELKKICKQQAYLSAWSKVTFIDENTWEEEVFQFNWWAKEYLQTFFNEEDLIINHWIEINLWKDEKNESYVWFDSVIFFTKKWTKKIKEITESFVNNVFTWQGWTHLNAYERWVVNAFRKFAEERWFNKKLIDHIQPQDILLNVFYVINAKIIETEFVWQTKDRLANKEISLPLRQNIEDLFYIELLKNPNEFDKIVQRAIELVQSRSKAEEFNFDEILKEIESESKVGKYLGRLKITSNKKAKPEEKMIYIVEWLSAGWSVMKTRDNYPIDLLALKGKILNIEERYDAKSQSLHNSILSNDEIRSIISAFGWSVWDNFDEEKFPYKWGVVIMADSDPDGWHISLLLMNLFHKLYWKEFVNKYLYISELPLFEIIYKWEKYYFNTNEEKEEFMKWKDIPDKDISRFKGLGEVPSKLFKELAITPETRRLRKLNITDSEETNELFYVFLWNDASLRRDFLDKQEIDLYNLDL